MSALTIANNPAALSYRNRLLGEMDAGHPINTLEVEWSAATYCELLLMEGHWTAGDRSASQYLAEIRQAHLNSEFGPAVARSVVARTFLGDAMTAYGLTLTALEREPDDGSVLGTSAFVGAVVGADRAREWATRTRDRGLELELTAFTIDGTHRLGLIELAADNPDGAYEHLTETWRLLTSHGYRHPGYAYARGDIAEVFARTGRVNEARQVITELETSPFESPWARGVAARARGILGESGQFQKALLLLEESPWEMARTRLCWARDKADAAQARQALEAFETMGARPWAAMARALCEGTKAQPVEDLVHPLDALSDRERTVALAVARGLSNKDVGGELFISLKTVDAHLQQIYRKLEIRSRTQLSALCYAA
jgi:DNA-binding CsgD family transcriptional regulator